MIVKGQKVNDRYQIIKTIGEGGMANVYLAYDTILDRNVAVKVLRGDLATDEKFVRRFQREALSASSLTHPNIVEVYDVGEDNGSYYIVMEYIEGKHLKQLLKKRGNLTLTEVVDIMLQVTDGMSAAHDSYIIHRDIKPQNIMILENGLIKITDFGIAMALNSTQLTQTNSVMGSVHYLPPEQASGKGATIQSDVYSMGILMYELLTGVLPFRGDNAVEIALKQIKEPFPRIKDKLPSIPQSIENIILKATAKNVKNRYNDAKEMHDDLKTALSDARADEAKITFKYPEEADDGGKKIKEDKKEVEVKETKEPLKKEEKNKVKKEIEEDTKEESIKSKKITDKELKELKKEENKILIILTSIFVGLVVIVTTVILLLPRLMEVKNVNVPNLTNMTLEEAEAALEDIGLTSAEYTKEIDSSDVKEGNIVKSSPASGKKVKKGTEVILYISTGEKLYEIEDLTGQNYLTVEGRLSTYGILVKYEYVPGASGDYKAGEIIKTEPEAGEKLKAGQSITLYIPDVSTEYPDFTSNGYTLTAIKEWCETYKVEFQEPEYIKTSEYPAGKIYKQTPAPGTKVSSGQKLKITIADEPDDSSISAEEIDATGNDPVEED